MAARDAVEGLFEALPGFAVEREAMLTLAGVVDDVSLPPRDRVQAAKELRAYLGGLPAVDDAVEGDLVDDLAARRASRIADAADRASS